MGIIVTYTGKDGAGKSTLLTNMACMLAAHGRTVGVLSTDMRYQSLPSLLLNTMINRDQSLETHFVRDTLIGAYEEYPHCANVFVGGMERGVNCITNEPPEPSAIRHYLSLLKDTFDYTLIEANDVMFNAFSATAIQRADVLIDVVSVTEEGLSYSISNTHLIRELNPNGEFLYVLNGDDGDIPESDIKLRLDGLVPTVILPWLPIVKKSTNRGIPVAIDPNAKISAKNYLRNMQPLCDKCAARAKSIEAARRPRAYQKKMARPATVTVIPNRETRGRK